MFGETMQTQRQLFAAAAHIHLEAQAIGLDKSGNGGFHWDDALIIIALAGYHVVQTEKSKLSKFARVDYLRTVMKGSKMQTRNISLTPEQHAFVEKVVKSGEYQNASEAVRDALRVLQHYRSESVLKLKVLRMQIGAGVDAIENGEFVDIGESELDGYLDALTDTPNKPGR